MCKHVAAVLYGVGARLDEQPELLFRLRAVNENDLVAQIGNALPLAKQAPAAGKVLQTDDMSALFGLEMAEEETAVVVPVPAARKVVPKKPAKAMGKPAKAMEKSVKVTAKPVDAKKKPAKVMAKPVATLRRSLPRLRRSRSTLRRSRARL